MYIGRILGNAGLHTYLSCSTTFYYAQNGWELVEMSLLACDF